VTKRTILISRAAMADTIQENRDTEIRKFRKFENLKFKKIGFKKKKKGVEKSGQQVTLPIKRTIRISRDSIQVNWDTEIRNSKT
jgi:HD superfamily phosphohydrolase YqeK